MTYALAGCVLFLVCMPLAFVSPHAAFWLLLAAVCCGVEAEANLT